jgi:hypothetical protein
VVLRSSLYESLVPSRLLFGDWKSEFANKHVLKIWCGQQTGLFARVQTPHLVNEYVLCFPVIHLGHIAVCMYRQHFLFKALTFSIRSAHISALKGKFVVAKVHIFMHSGI